MHTLKDCEDHEGHEYLIDMRRGNTSLSSLGDDVTVQVLAVNHRMAMALARGHVVGYEVIGWRRADGQHEPDDLVPSLQR